MIKYMFTAMALKAFSLSRHTRKAYRDLGNSIGAKKRENGKIPNYYLNRINWTLHLNRTFGFPKDGDNLLEIGTGWLHWEAITNRLFFNIKAVLYDVWDNRQLNGIKNYLTQLDSRLHEIDASDSQRDHAHQLIKEIKKVSSFSDLYDLLGFEYRVDPHGKLGQLELRKFNVIVSAGVMEHIPEKDVCFLVKDISGLLKPGGYSAHSINIRDHLFAYDNSISQKQYLTYSDRAWKTWFENQVQYINRIQRSEWLTSFEKVGLELVKEEVENISLSNIVVGKRFQKYDIADLSCGNLKVVHRKG